MNDTKPYLQDSEHKYNTYLIKQRTPTETWGIVSKWVDLEDADWERKAWQHELNWEGEWGKRDRLAYETLVSRLLIESRVVSPNING